MKKTMKTMLAGLLAVPVLAFGASVLLPVAPTASAQCQQGVSGGITAGAECARGSDQEASLFGVGGIFQTIVNVLLFIIGAIAVIMLVIGGIRYVVSGGDSSAVTGAKNTILYAVVGIIVALLAYAIVNFVLTEFTA